MALESEPRNQHVGCILVGLVVIGLISLAYCSKTPEQPATTASSNNAEALAAPQQLTKVPPLQPLSRAAARRGLGHFKLASTAEGAVGALIYSRNCYDALVRQFTWAKLDTCGAFDTAAAQKFADDVSLTQEQQGYFDPETTAGRFLSVATKAGEPASDADNRLAKLQKRIRAAAKPASVPVPIVEAEAATIADAAVNADIPNESSENAD